MHLIDGVPIPLCYSLPIEGLHVAALRAATCNPSMGREYLCRASRCRSFEGVADYGYCASKKMYYYGFHGHLLISSTGIVTQFALTPANGDERETLWDLVSNIHGFLIGDKGYLSQPLKHELLQFAIDLETALRSNMHDSRLRWWVRLIVKIRRLIETVIGQLVGRFHLDKVWAKDIWHLSSRLNRKLLAHTVCFWLNRHSPQPLQFEDLVSS